MGFTGLPQDRLAGRHGYLSPVAAAHPPGAGDDVEQLPQRSRMSSQHSSRAKRSEVDTEMAAVAEAGRLNHMNASAAVFGNLGFVQLYRDHGYDRTPCIAQRERPHPSSLRSPCYRCIPGGPQQDDTMPSSPCALSGRS